MSTTGLTVLAVLSGLLGLVVATVASRRSGRLGPRPVLAAGLGAGLLGGAASALMVLRDGAWAFWDLAHLLYLATTVTVPLMAAGLALLASPLARWAGPGGGLRRAAPRPLWALVVVGLLPAALGFYATHVEPYWLRVDRLTVGVDPARAGDDEVRIAVLADLQTPGVGDHERAAVERMMAAEPDVILLPGDLFQDPGATNPEGIAEVAALLATLHAPHGVYFVRGDADGGDGDVAERMLAGTEVVTLVDESTDVRVGDRVLRIGGTALSYDSPAADAVRADLQAQPADGAITVLVSHRPDTVLDLPAGSRVDLTVAGHTHGGQIVIPVFGPPVTFTDVPRDVARGGLHDLDGNQIYVSPGVGLERGPAPQVRFLSRPAIAILTLADAP